MRKLIWFMFMTMLSVVVFAEQYTYRITVDGIEYLMTANPEEKWFCLEKAILLTANQYDMDVFIERITPQDATIYTDIKIGASAFENNEYISSLVIYGNGDDIKMTICEKAFKNCANLASVRFLDLPIVSIENSAFEGCNSNETDSGISVGMEMDVTSITNIGDRAFLKCKISCGWEEDLYFDAIQHIGENAFDEWGYYWDPFRIILPESYRNIEKSAFRNDTKLREGRSSAPIVVFPATLESIEDEAFYNYRSFYNAIEKECPINDHWDLIIPIGTHTIGVSAFEGASFDSLILPTSLKYIGEKAFAGNTQYDVSWGKLNYSSILKGTVVIPSSVQKIGDNFLSYNPYLKKIVFECNIDHFPFISDCHNLEEIVIPQSVKTGIAGNLFYNCSKLKLFFEGRPPSNMNSKCFDNV